MCVNADLPGCFQIFYVLWNTLTKLLFQYYRVHLNSEVNSMDSKNLAICWWPTIIRAVISNVNDLKSMGKAMEEITITLIEQHGFFFYNEHEV